MIIGRFLLWARHAPADQRAEAVAALAGAYLAGEMRPLDAFEAETALTAVLDDPSPCVRLALAEALATSQRAPKHLLLGLVSDRADIATILVANSPLLDDADLVDCVAMADDAIQVAVASRRPVSESVSAALAEIGAPAALIALVRNDASLLTPATFARIMERHGEVAPVREALLARPDLPIEVAQSIAAALAATLFGTGEPWLSPERAARDERAACDRATVSLAMQAGPDDLVRLVRHLRRSGQMTATLLLRSLLCGNRPLVECSLVELSGQPSSQIAAILNGRRAPAFRALYGRTGLPISLRPAFEAGLAALHRHGAEDGPNCGPAGRARLSRPLIEATLAACRDLPEEQGNALVALLRRFDVEAAREAAREGALAIADSTALRFMLEKAPEMLQIEDRSARAA